jgi:hypothetical protein
VIALKHFFGLDQGPDNKSGKKSGTIDGRVTARILLWTRMSVGRSVITGRRRIDSVLVESSGFAAQAASKVGIHCNLVAAA